MAETLCELHASPLPQGLNLFARLADSGKAIHPLSAPDHVARWLMDGLWVTNMAHRCLGKAHWNGERACRLLALPALLAVTALALGEATRFGFLNLDDPLYVSRNPRVTAGLSLSNLGWALTSLHASNWHPLTWLSLQLDATLYGLNASGFHLTNLFLHAFSSCLLFLTLRRATGAPYRSLLVSVLFAVHPTVCESVLWVAERKSVLAMCFGMLSLYSYVRWAKSADRAWYAACLAAFLLGLLAKPVLVSLPIVLVLLDYWPLRRTARPVSRWREKIPFVFGSLASSVITLIAQKRGESLWELATLPAGTRIANCLDGYLRYLGHVFWPVHLVPFYPMLPCELFSMRAAAAALCLAGISMVAWRWRRRHPSLLFGWLWFLITLFPTNGLVQVGMQAIADRYLYLPIIGVLVAVIWTLAEAAASSVIRRRSAAVLALGVVASLIGETRALASHWASSEMLWRYADEIAPGGWTPEYKLAEFLVEAERYPEAETIYRRLIDSIGNRSELVGLDERVAQSYGVLLLRMKRPSEARRQLARAIHLDPQDAMNYHNLGLVDLLDLQLDQAALSFGLALQRGLVPPTDDYQKLARELARQGQRDMACMLLTEMQRVYRDHGLTAEAEQTGLQASGNRCQTIVSKVPQP